MAEQIESRPPKQTFCERCGEPCGNAKLCGTCLAQEPAPDEDEAE